MSEVTTARSDRQIYEEAYQQAPALPWPDQVHYLDDGSIELRPPSREHKFGNPDSVVSPHSERVVETVLDNWATIVRSPTGTGKTTELTIALMESGEFEKVYVTQPRIVAARSVTEYERSRLAEVLGDDLAEELLGWHTAPDSNYDELMNVIINMTDGIPVQQFLNGNFLNDKQLLVIDEAHEAKINMHLLMLICKKLNIRVLIMSATVDVDEVANYFADENGVPAPVIDIEGSTFPIEERVFTAREVKGTVGRPARANGSVTIKPGQSIADVMNAEATAAEAELEAAYRDVYTATQEYARRGLDVLIFVPDIKDVHRIMAKLRSRVPQGCSILGLYGDQTPDQQAAALASYPGGKVIVATDVAMTSLTPNVDVVLDSGMSRAAQLEAGTDGVAIAPSSLAARDQRRGRCGRTKPGTYEMVHVPGYPVPLGRDELDDYSTPEIRGKRPDEVLLKLAKLGLQSTEGLMIQPEDMEVELAVRRLRRLGAVALDGYYEGEIGELTDIGKQMVELPLDVRAARMLVESYGYDQSLQLQMAAMVAAWQVNGVHSASMNRSQRKRFSTEVDNDLLVGLDVFIGAAKMDPAERAMSGISEQKFKRAWTAYERIVGRHIDGSGSDADSDLNSLHYQLVPPTDIERAQLQACMMSGIDEVYVARARGKLTNSGKRSRKKSNNSQIYTQVGDLVAGVPFNVGRMSGNKVSTARLVTAAMRVDVDSLRQFTPDRIDESTLGKFRINKQGNPEEEIAVRFDGHSIGKTYWRAAEASTEAGKYLLDYTFSEELIDDSMLPESIIQMRRQLAELRALQSRTNDKLDIDSVVERMKEIIRQNADDDTVEFSQVPSVSFDMSGVVSDEQRIDILNNAPDMVQLYNDVTQEFVDVPVEYKGNVAYLALSKEHYPLLGREIVELGGRQVMVRPVGGHKYLDQGAAFEARGARRFSRGTIVAPEEVRRRREVHQADQNKPQLVSQVAAATLSAQTAVPRQQRGRAPRQRPTEA